MSIESYELWFRKILVFASTLERVCSRALMDALDKFLELGLSRPVL